MFLQIMILSVLLQHTPTLQISNFAINSGDLYDIYNYLEHQIILNQRLHLLLFTQILMKATDEVVQYQCLKTD